MESDAELRKWKLNKTKIEKLDNLPILHGQRIKAMHLISIHGVKRYGFGCDGLCLSTGRGKKRILLSSYTCISSQIFKPL